MKRKYGDQRACKFCGHDIEWHGRAHGWIDRGAGRGCLPFIERGEVIRPKTKHAAIGERDWL